MLADFRADLQRSAGASRPGVAQTLRLLVNDYGLQALAVYRVGAWIERWRARPALRPLAALAAPAHRAFGALVRRALDIHLDAASIGPGLRIYHLGGIRLRRCTLGAHCVIHQEVRIEPGPDGGEGPQVGDRVWIGPHARIVGPVRVGDGATVGAGAVVTQDVAPRTIVLGAPARVMRVDHDNAEILDSM